MALIKKIRRENSTGEMEATESNDLIWGDFGKSVNSSIQNNTSPTAISIAELKCIQKNQTWTVEQIRLFGGMRDKNIPLDLSFGQKIFMYSGYVCSL